LKTQIFLVGPSQILECEIVDEDGNVKTFNPKPTTPHSLEVQTDEVMVLPDHKVKVRGKATQYRRIDDMIFETFLYPAINPKIDVTIPDDFEHYVEFGTKGDVEKAKYRNLYTLSGVYFPGQYMSVRWWPRKPQPVNE
jgi:hypothetical protein